jgi:hypothetical protein
MSKNKKKPIPYQGYMQDHLSGPSLLHSSKLPPCLVLLINRETKAVEGCYLLENNIVLADYVQRKAARHGFALKEHAVHSIQTSQEWEEELVSHFDPAKEGPDPIPRKNNAFVNVPRRRGRHPGNCQCLGCHQKRSEKYAEKQWESK